MLGLEGRAARAPLACAGKHFGRWSVLIAPRLLAPLYALTGRSGRAEDFREDELSSLQLEVAEAVLAEGPCTGPELRALVGAEKKPVDAALVVLQRALVLTNAGVVEQRQGWGAIAVDLLARRFDVSTRPSEGEARRLLAATVLAVVWRAVGGGPRRSARLAPETLAGDAGGARRARIGRAAGARRARALERLPWKPCLTRG